LDRLFDGTSVTVIVGVIPYESTKNRWRFVTGETVSPDAGLLPCGKVACASVKPCNRFTGNTQPWLAGLFDGSVKSVESV